MTILVPLLRFSLCTGEGEGSRVLSAAPAIEDASLQVGIGVTNLDMTKRAKTVWQKFGLVDAGELLYNSPSFRILRWVKQKVA